MSIYSLSLGNSKKYDKNQSLNEKISDSVPKNEQNNSFMT